MQKNILLVFTTLLIIFYQNCSRVVVEDMAIKSSDVGNLETVAYEELKMNCEKAANEGKLKSQVLMANFPNVKKTCDWQNNGNLGEVNGKIRARREQQQVLSLNMGAKVCSLNMKSNLSDKFYYDDNIFLNLNGYILASTSNFSKHLINQNGFYKYDWALLVDKEAQNLASDTVAEKQYCAGAASGLSNCSFPKTETYGTLNLQFTDEVFQKIFSMTSANRVELTMVTTGDNNVETDCQHVDLDFAVEIFYYD